MLNVCKPFRAWINLMPPRPDDFHIVGGVEVGNPGVLVILTKVIPQGINPKILILELSHVQQPGNWPQVVTCAQCRYDEIMDWNDDYAQVSVRSGGAVLATIDVVEIVR